MALTDNQKALLRLIQRSTPNETGWYLVSNTIWPLVDGKLPPDIAETATNDRGVHFLKLTDRGKAVLDYL